jgi:hypothetical protein
MVDVGGGLGVGKASLSFTHRKITKSGEIHAISDVLDMKVWLKLNCLLFCKKSLGKSFYTFNMALQQTDLVL